MAAGSVLSLMRTSVSHVSIKALGVSHNVPLNPFIRSTIIHNTSPFVPCGSLHCTHTHTHLKGDNRPMNHVESHQQPNKAGSQFATSGPFPRRRKLRRVSAPSAALHPACGSFPVAPFRRLMANSKGIGGHGFSVSRGLEYGEMAARRGSL